MAGFVVASLVIGGLGWLLLRYAAPRATTRSQALTVMGFAAFLGLALGVVALGLLAERAKLDALQKTQPLSTLEAVVAHRSDPLVIVEGRISAKTTTVLEDYVAYYHTGDDENFRMPDLSVELDDGREVIVEEPYEPLEWNDGSGWYRGVKVGDQVVVIGDAVATGSNPFDDAAIDGANLTGAQLFKGSFGDFRTRYLPTTRPYAVVALIWALLCPSAALVIFFVPLPRLWRSLRRPPSSGAR